MNISDFKFDQNKKTVLIVDSFANGRAIVDRLTKSGLGLINFEYTTLKALVEKLTNDYVSSHIKNIRDIKSSKIKVLKDSYFSFLLRNIISSNPGLLSYIDKNSYSLETFEEILRVINIIRKVDIKNTNNKKVIELINLKNKFERELVNVSIDGSKGVYDSIRLLKEFKDEYVDNCQYFIVKEYYERLLPLEKKVVDKIVKSQDRLIGVCSNIEVTPKTYTSYGKFNEVQGVLDKISNQNLNDVTIYYSSSIYENYLRAALKNRKIPYKFQNEISAGDNQLYCLIQDIILWAENSYRYSLFKKICLNPLLNYAYKSEDGSSTEERFFAKDYEELKKAHIDYSLERYDNYIKNVENVEYKNCIDDLSFEPMVVSDKFNSFVEDICSLFRQNGKNPGTFLFNLVKFINKYRDKTQDASINYSVIRFLYDYSKILKLYGDVEDEFEIFDVVKKSIGMLTVEEKDDMFLSEKFEGEKNEVLSSYINVCKLSQSFILGRKINYFIGMSFNEFKSDSFDSPVLSDDIIDQSFDDGHDNKLILNRYNQIRMDENFKQSLTTSEVNFDVNLVSSTYDTVNFNEVSPSNLFMQYRSDDNSSSHYDFVYKNIVKNSLGHDFERFYNELITLYPNQNLIRDEKDINGNIINKASYPLHINVEHYFKNEIEYVRYKNASLSPSRIQKVFNCPYSFIYALSNIYIDDEEEGEKELSSWLKPNDLGNFYHEIFEKYAISYLIDKEPIYTSSEEIYANLFTETANKYLNVFGKQAQFNSEYEKLYVNVSYTLDSILNDLNDSSYKVKYAELKCSSNYLKIPVSDNKILEIQFYGTIDRIDLDEDGNYRIIDYKSSSVKKIDEKIRNRSYLQHIIYPYMLKAYLGDELKDSRINFSYVSIEDFGEEINFTIDTSTFEPLAEIAEKLFDVGSSLDKEQIVFDENNPCRYCKLNDICFMRLKGRKLVRKDKNKKDKNDG